MEELRDIIAHDFQHNQCKHHLLFGPGIVLKGMFINCRTVLVLENGFVRLSHNNAYDPLCCDEFNSVL